MTQIGDVITINGHQGKWVVIGAAANSVRALAELAELRTRAVIIGLRVRTGRALAIEVSTGAEP